jgi:hypothetical protein
MIRDPSIELLCNQWKEIWPAAKQVWNPFVKLREPVWCLQSEKATLQGLTGSFAMIRLNDHRIVIDLERIKTEGLDSFAIEILAHEIGHHIYTPANLHDNAKLLYNIRWGLADIENRAPFVANLYADMLINDTLQRSRNLNMAGVYQQINRKSGFSKLWVLFMRTYEYLWRMERGSLATATDMHSPAIDADASLAASLIRSYSKNWIDGAARYAALLYPYLMEEEEYMKARARHMVLLDAENAGEGGGVISGLTEIDAEAIAGAIDPRAEASGKAAPAGIGKNMEGGEGPKQRYLNPGKYIDLFRQVNPKADEQELINNYYREIALPHLVDFPVEKSNPVSYTLPEGIENWDISDPMEEIDWIQTAIIAPEVVPGYNTVKRVYGPEDCDSDNQKPLDVYIGIDCSGSMGNPRVQFSWPVLAATIIGLSALRAGAKVMACLSGEPGSFMETKGFSTSQKEVLTVLTSYLGTGYAYGVPRLQTPFGKPHKDKSHAIIVTDDDIFSMLGAEKPKDEESNWKIIEKALENAGGVGTIVLHSRPQWHRAEVIRLQKMGWHIYYVTNEEELLTFAAEFSHSHYKKK